MLEGDNLENTENLDVDASIQLAKHCPNPDCFLYMKPQLGRTWCAECDTELVY